MCSSDGWDTNSTTYQSDSPNQTVSSADALTETGKQNVCANIFPYHPDGTTASDYLASNEVLPVIVVSPKDAVKKSFKLKFRGSLDDISGKETYFFDQLKAELKKINPTIIITRIALYEGGLFVKGIIECFIYFAYVKHSFKCSSCE